MYTSVTSKDMTLGLSLKKNPKHKSFWPRLPCPVRYRDQKGISWFGKKNLSRSRDFFAACPLQMTFCSHFPAQPLCQWEWRMRSLSSPAEQKGWGSRKYVTPPHQAGMRLPRVSWFYTLNSVNADRKKLCMYVLRNVMHPTTVSCNWEGKDRIAERT